MRIDGSTEQRAALFAALAKAQGEFGSAKKSADNPFFKSKYADLSEILSTALPITSKNGLAIIQGPSTVKGEGIVEVETILAHQDGATLSCTFAGKAQLNDRINVMQAIGSTVTYLRRYSVQAILGINVEMDDDGNGSGPRGTKPQPQQLKGSK